MAKLTDPDDLVVATSIGNLGVNGNIFLDTSAKTFSLGAYGVLVAKDGVTGNAIWAKFVDLWTTATYQPYAFPMNILDARSGQYIFGQDPGGSYNGWKPADSATRQMIRDAGWSEYSNAGVLNRQYVGMVALASGFPAGAQFYYQLTSTGAAANFTFTDAPNEAIQVYGDASNGNFDSRAYFKLFCREYNYSYDDAVLGDVGESGTGAYKVALPIAVGSDLKITADDTAVGANSPYTQINVRYFAQAFTKDVDSATDRNFGIVIDVGTHSGVDGSTSASGNTLSTTEGGINGSDYTGGTLTIHEGANAGVYAISGTPTATNVIITTTFANTLSNQSFTLQRAAPVSASLAQIYTKVNYLLRQNSNINTVTGSVTGKTAGLLLNFVGDSLKCGFYTPTNPNGGGSGVIVEGIAAADLNSIVFYDNTGASREYPYAAAGTLNFNSFLTAGGTGYYRMYFTNDDAPGDNLGYDYGTANAITVNDKDGVPIAGTISAASIAFTYSYSTNVQRGAGSGGSPAAITIIAGNAGSAKPVVATGTISQSKGISITLTAEQDRGYLV